MSGRFLSAPAWLGALMLGRLPFASPRLSLAPAAIVAAFSLGVPHAPARFTTPQAQRGRIEPTGITDEGRYYRPTTGLWTPAGMRTEPAWADLREKVARFRAEGRRVVVADAIGMLGYLAGPEVHFVDVMALSDPLLARLPAERPWRVGHYRRAVPKGYLETLSEGANRIENPGTAALWDDLALVTRGPLFSRERWRAILALNFGRVR